ncbi:MAG: hypothetical protein RDV48_12115 [Candidatus Eremiobacteraeota bacterium]|nr:hypothetical protein [Candidatus Eremiobacteraeota bacterium]
MQKFWKKKGLALASIMVVMLVLSLLAVSVVGLTTNQYRYSLKKQNETLTMQAALAGLDAAEKALDRDPLLPDKVNNWDQLAPNSNLVGWTRVGEKNLSYRVDLVDSTADTCTVISTARLEGPRGSIDKEKKVKATFKKNCFLYAAYGNGKNAPGVTAEYNSKIIGDVGSSRADTANAGKKVNAVTIGQLASDETSNTVTQVAVTTNTQVQLQQSPSTSTPQVSVNQMTSTVVNSSGGGSSASQMSENSTQFSTSSKPPPSASPSALLSISLSQSMTLNNFVPPIKISQSTSINISNTLNPISFATTSYSLSQNKRELDLEARSSRCHSSSSKPNSNSVSVSYSCLSVSVTFMKPPAYYSPLSYYWAPPPKPQVTIPQVKPPQVTTPQVTMPQVKPPQVTTPQVTSPQVTSPQVTSPQATAPEGETEPQSSISPSTGPSAYLTQQTPFDYSAWYTTMQSWSINGESAAMTDTSQIIGEIYVTPDGEVKQEASEGHLGTINRTYVEKLTSWIIPVPRYQEPDGLAVSSAVPGTIKSGSYVYDTFEVTGSTITIDASKGPIILYVRSKFALSGSTINFASGTPCDPRNLIVYCSSYCSVSIKDQSKCSLLLAASSADIDVQGKSYVIGSLLGNKVKCTASVIEYPKGRLKDMRDRALLVAWEELP